MPLRYVLVHTTQPFNQPAENIELQGVASPGRGGGPFADLRPVDALACPKQLAKLLKGDCFVLVITDRPPADYGFLKGRAAAESNGYLCRP